MEVKINKEIRNYAQEICTTYGLMNKGRLFATGDITELRSMACQNTTVRIKASRMPKDRYIRKLEITSMRWM